MIIMQLLSRNQKTFPLSNDSKPNIKPIISQLIPTINRKSPPAISAVLFLWLKVPIKNSPKNITVAIPYIEHRNDCSIFHFQIHWY